MSALRRPIKTKIRESHSFAEKFILFSFSFSFLIHAFTSYRQSTPEIPSEFPVDPSTDVSNESTSPSAPAEKTLSLDGEDLEDTGAISPDAGSGAAPAADHDHHDYEERIKELRIANEDLRVQLREVDKRAQNTIAECEVQLEECQTRFEEMRVELLATRREAKELEGKEVGISLFRFIFIFIFGRQFVAM